MAGDGLREAIVAQAVLWLVVAIYLGAVWGRMDVLDVIPRATVLLMFVTALYYFALTAPEKPKSSLGMPSGPPAPPLVRPLPNTPRVSELPLDLNTKADETPEPPLDLKSKSGTDDDENVLRKQASAVTEAAKKVDKDVEKCYDQLQSTLESIAKKTETLSDAVKIAAGRLEKADESLSQALDDLERKLTETHHARIEVLPVRGVDPSLASKAQQHVLALLGSRAYRQSVATLANDACLTDEVAYHLSSLRRRSSDLYARSVLKRGGTSLRMQAWAKDNADAEDSIRKVQPLLRRLKGLNDLDGSQESTDRFLAGLRSPELTAMGIFLVRSRDAVGNEQQVKTALELLARAILQLWLAPTVRLYQLLHEALRMEDEQLAEFAMRLYGAGDDPSIPNALDSVRSAADILGFEYVHHELYVVNPYEIQAKVDQNTPRHSFAEWTSGETGDGRSLPVAKDAIGRVMIPDFRAKSARPFETEIMIIKRDQ